jgi:hypothetical protein
MPINIMTNCIVCEKRERESEKLCQQTKERKLDKINITMKKKIRVGILREDELSNFDGNELSASNNNGKKTICEV